MLKRYYCTLLLGLVLLAFCYPLLAQKSAITFTHIKGERYFANSFIVGIIEDHDGYIWIASNGGGLYRYDGYNLKVYMSDFVDKRSISDNGIFSLTIDREGIIWLGTEAGLNAFDPVSETAKIFKNRPEDTTAFPTKIVYSVIEDPLEEFIWAGTDMGLIRFNKKNFKWKLWVVNKKEGPDAYGENQIRYLLHDHEDQHTIWLGSDHGLISFNKEEEEYTFHRNTFNENLVWDHIGVIRQLPIKRMHQLENGMIWMGTQGGGVFSYDPKTNRWSQFKYEVPPDPRHVMGHNVVGEVYPLNNGTFWLAGNERVGVFKPSSTDKESMFDFLVPSPEDSTSILESDYNEIFVDTRGRLWMGGYYGLSFSKAGIFPSTIEEPLEVAITHFTGKTAPVSMLDNISYTDSFALPYKDRDVTIGFAVINPSRKEEVEYAYAVPSFTSRERWKETTQRTQSFRKFWGGQYQFLVKARYKGGDWGPIRSIWIDLETPYWQKWWFAALILISISSLAFSFYSYLLRQRKEREVLESQFRRELMEMEMSALRAQMNPHFLFNCLNSIKHFIIKNNPKDASRYLSKFSQLMRLILQNSKTPLVTLSHELKALELYMQMESLRFDNKFNFTVSVDEMVEADHIAIPPMILQPYVENAIWHGLMHKEGEGLLKIGVQRSNESLNISIEDNGIGREKSMALKSKTATLRKSYGMQITSDRLALVKTIHNIETEVMITDLKDKLGRAVGTRVELVIPVSFQQHLMYSPQ